MVAANIRVREEWDSRTNEKRKQKRKEPASEKLPEWPLGGVLEESLGNTWKNRSRDRTQWSE